MAGREDDILILISDRGLQLGPLAQALGNLGLPYDPPPGDAFTNDDGVRAVYCVLRIVKSISIRKPDYIAHRALLGLFSGVGLGTAKGTADACIQHNQNFHDLFYLAALPQWLSSRQSNAVGRLTTIVQAVSGWALADTLTVRSPDITQLLGNVFAGAAQAANIIASWTALAGTFPGGTTLEELLSFFAADNESDRRTILESVNQRLGVAQPAAAVQQKRIRILTMHGAKGLSGKVVFIPWVEQGIMPSFRNLQAAGLLIEHRRLFYVSVTRAMAACIISHSAQHLGASAFRLRQQPMVMLPRSQFLNEMGIPSVNRAGGLTAVEAQRIVADVNHL